MGVAIERWLEDSSDPRWNIRTNRIGKEWRKDDSDSFGEVRSYREETEGWWDVQYIGEARKQNTRLTK